MNNTNENARLDKTVINWFPGHMAKAKRELKEMMPLIDIVYEVIDARMPISSKVYDIDDIIKDKPKILVISKYDLCDKKETNRILESYGNYTIVKCDLLNDNIQNLINETKKISDKMNDDRLKKGMKKRKARVVVIGAPNVGKSTLINKLVGKKVVQTGNTPGVTKSLGWIRINNDIELMDSPGILWPKLENQENAHILASFSSIKEEILDKEDLSRFIINKLEELYQEKLKERYKLDIIDKETIFDDIAKKRGLLAKGGVTDYEKVYNTIIKDLKDGAFGNITFDRLEN
ncbi:MAG: ribosome biogenesis GTPase YlqF [Bacilli bacterium]|nr:ribosome biogenesis GTPase YlqF [Bacilli bacterium]